MPAQTFLGLPYGSSPRGRGKPGAVTVGAWARGLIPAGAGKTLCVACQLVRVWAHPRGGGENGRGGRARPAR